MEQKDDGFKLTEIWEVHAELAVKCFEFHVDSLWFGFDNVTGFHKLIEVLGNVKAEHKVKLLFFIFEFSQFWKKIELVDSEIDFMWPKTKDL